MRWFLTRVLVIGFPIVEILLIFWVAGTIGWGWTLGLLAAGLVVGLLIMRTAGLNAFRAVAAPMKAHQPYVEIDEATGVAQTVHPNTQPSADEVEQAGLALRQSGLLFVSGVLFAIPGFITDVLGAGLLIPQVRRLVAGRMPERSAGPSVVIRGETIGVDVDVDVTATTHYEPGPDEGPVVIRGEILPPQRPIE